MKLLLLLAWLSQSPSLPLSPSPAVTSSLILAAVEDALSPLLTAEGGILSVAETEEDAIELLAVSPEKWRVVLCMDGDKSLEDTNPCGLVEGRLVAFVQAPKGMAAQPARNIHRAAVKGTPAFLTRLHWVIRKIRGLSLIASDIDRQGFRYQGWEWLKFDGLAALRTARASFDLIFAHDDPATDPTGTEPVTLPSPFRIVAATDEFYVIAFSGTAHGRVPRYLAVEGDPSGTATGYAVTAATEDFYTVAYDGSPHGRIPRFVAA